jgi:hypothetical protein
MKLSRSVGLSTTYVLRERTNIINRPLSAPPPPPRQVRWETAEKLEETREIEASYDEEIKIDANQEWEMRDWPHGDSRYHLRRR